MNDILIPSLLLLTFLLIVTVFGIAIVIPNILAIILALDICLDLMLMRISLSLSLTVFLVAFFYPIVPYGELVCFVEIYCRCIVNSVELMKISLVHIKLPIPYNRFFPMSEFIKPTVPLHRLFAGESVKKRGNTARSKERNIWPDDLCFLQIIDKLAVWVDKSIVGNHT